MRDAIKPDRIDAARFAPKLTDIVKGLLDLPTRIAAGPVFKVANENQRHALQAIELAQDGRAFDEVVDEMLEQVYDARARMNHPRCFAFIPTPASPLSWIGDMLTAAHNPFAGSWLQGSGPSIIERKLVQFLCTSLGLPASSGGLFVSGGSMANLTALTVARDRMLEFAQRNSAVLYVSAQTHSSVAKGMKIIGFRDQQIRRIDTDERFRMDMNQLRCAIEQDRSVGHVPFAVVATAGTTNTGSIDPLCAIADLCHEQRLWMHVDGAFGASIALSTTHAGKLAGIERADSVSWDAHKWLFQTYGCGAVLVRDRRHLLESFHTRAEYLADADTGNDDALNYWDLGPELTRPARALKLWLTLQVTGLRAMSEAIEHGIQLAEWAEDEVRNTPGWQIVSPAQLAIVVFRYSPQGIEESEIDRINLAISRRAMEEGFCAVLTTRLNGRTVLRICSIHPNATEWDMRETVRRLDTHAGQEMKQRASQRS